ERIEAGCAAPPIAILERRADVVHGDPEQRVPARLPGDVEPLEEERRPRAARAIESERVPQAHAHRQRRLELVAEARYLKSTRSRAGAEARAHADRGREMQAREVDPVPGVRERRQRNARREAGGD